MKKCPYCAEDIQDAAVKCKHCGSMLGVQQVRSIGLEAVAAVAMESERTRHIVSAVSALAGGLGIGIAPFLPYLTSSLLSASGFQKLGGLLATSQVATGAVAIILGVIGLILSRSFRRSWGYAAGLTCALNARFHRLIAANLDELSKKDIGPLQGFLDGTIGAGVWVTYVGSLLLFVAALTGNHKKGPGGNNSSAFRELKGTIAAPAAKKAGPRLERDRVTAIS